MELHLRGDYTEDMLNKADRKLNPRIREDNELRFVIYFLYASGVEAGDISPVTLLCLLASRRQGICLWNQMSVRRLSDMKSDNRMVGVKRKIGLP